MYFMKKLKDKRLCVNIYCVNNDKTEFEEGNNKRQEEFKLNNKEEI